MVTVPQASLKFMETLARRFDPEDLADILAEIMQAETPPIVTKDGLVVTRPDYRTRLEGLKFAYAYVVGRPVERQQRPVARLAGHRSGSLEHPPGEAGGIRPVADRCHKCRPCRSGC